MNCSTSEVYGIVPDGVQITEEFPVKPTNPYAVSKAAADLYGTEQFKNNLARGFTTRAFSHTGPRRRSNYSISSDAIQIAKILKRQQSRIIKIGNLESQRVVMDVRDTALVYYRLMLRHLLNDMPNGEIYNISGNGLHKIQFFLDLMETVFQTKAERQIDEKLFRPIDIPVQNPNSDKVRKFLNWEPTIPIKDTLIDLVNYWMERV